jgi:hypothetical protein
MSRPDTELHLDSQIVAKSAFQTISDLVRVLNIRQNSPNLDLLSGTPSILKCPNT